jgi:hypothetical protein
MTGTGGNDTTGDVETRTVHTTKRLEALRALMNENQIDA